MRWPGPRPSWTACGAEPPSSRRRATRRPDTPSVSADLVAILGPAADDSTDGLTAIAAAHGLATLRGHAADHALRPLLDPDRAPLAAHVALTLGDGPIVIGLLPALARLVGDGGLPGMQAQTTLGRWSQDGPDAVEAALSVALAQRSDVAGRRNLVETIGLIPGSTVMSLLATLAVDRSEADGVRVAAVAALGDRWTDPLPVVVTTLAATDGAVGDAARLAALDHEIRRRWALDRRVGRASVGGPGLRIAQIHLGGTMDPGLRRSGAGDTGGIATLLVKLGDALVQAPEVHDVLTIGRGTAADALAMTTHRSAGHRFMPVPLDADQRSMFTSAWPARVAAARGIRRALLTHGRPDVIHLRMADAGTLAAAEVAVELDIPTAFTLAPDPHARIAALEAAGRLDRGSFLDEDAAEHLWYRVGLVDHLARSAAEVVLFPREGLADRLRSFAGFDLDREAHRSTVVAEGIDIAQVAAADDAARSGAAVPACSAVADLLDQIDARPAARHGLPIVVSAGRLQELKGMARLVTAFAEDPELRQRATLVIVGGDLIDPSPEERAELDRIEATLARDPAAADAVILLGHRPHRELAALNAVARHGLDDRIAADGAYACASHKEEFGLAIVEALAAGLPVVAPREGGPATYVEAGRTGVLVDTASTSALAVGVQRALDLAVQPGRADHAVATIRARYDIATMARSLGSVYGRTTTRRTERLAS